ncbi:MAG TPA: S1 RNA-binding domain-containing protein [Thermoanaerobaculia bacterium]|jgi:small subunit ribosomal protein S1|nr:S1 RNA-binding domain-containing protein [Thermoanaerobaculia bacterium]
MADQQIENENVAQDFAQALAEFEQQGGEKREDPPVGAKVTGKILSIGEETAFVDLGTKSEAVIETAQLKDAEGNLTANVGDSIDATVATADENGLQLRRRAGTGGGGGGGKNPEAAAEVKMAWQHGIPVDGVVSGINKGGAEVQVRGMRAFCPLSQLDLRYVEDPAQFVGQRLAFKVTQFEDGRTRPNIVLSRRAILEEEQKSKAAEARSRIQVGSVVTGKVTSLASYGAFVDLGGIEGMLHVSEIGYSRLAHPKEALSVGQDIEVQVIKIEKGKDEKKPERISLSRRSLEKDPWRDAASRFPEGTEIPGRVMRLESFGAFVEIAPGLEGLLHISEIGGGKRLNHSREGLQLGQDIRVRVLNVDAAKRRISLGMAGADDDREEVAASGGSGASASKLAPQSGFGSMADFFKNAKRAK